MQNEFFFLFLTPCVANKQSRLQMASLETKSKKKKQKEYLRGISYMPVL